MKFNKMKMLPLVAKLGEYLNEGFDHYIKLQASGAEIDADSLAVFVNSKMETWKPKLNGKDLLDDKTRKAASRFVAGVAFNLAK